jgi:hypothetical protein
MSFNAIPFFGLNFQKDEYLLDLESASVAYSVRKLNRNYTGPCIKIRNSLGNQQDINFVDDYVDIDAINTFRNLGSGFASVSVIYDQSGNGFDLTPASSADEPILAELSTSYILYTNNGILSMRNRGRMYNITRLTAYDGVGEVWFSHIAKPTSNSAEGILSHVCTSGGRTYGINNIFTSSGWRAGGRRLAANAFQSLTISSYNNTFHNMISRYDYNNSDLFIYENNILTGTRTDFQTDGVTDTTDIKLFGLGANVANNASIWSGQFSEVVLFTGSIDKDKVYENQKDFFSLT